MTRRRKEIDVCPTPGLIFDSGFGGVRAGGAYLVGRTDLLFARQRVGREGHKRSVMHVMGNISNSVRLVRSRLISGVATVVR